MNVRRGVRIQGLAGELFRDEPMSRHTSWRVGGPADRCYHPAHLADLLAFLKRLPESEPLTVVGLGSNLLVRDGGIRGTVLLMHAALKEISVSGGAGEPVVVDAQAGVAAPKVARAAAVYGAAGAEFLAGIPGTVGGALAMNAGCYGGETWNLVTQVQTFDRRGVLRTRTSHDYLIGYRHVLPATQRPQEWFASGRFELPPGSPETARARIKELLSLRIASQPLQEPNAGSVFRNPPGDHAARLIEAAGLKGQRVGAAEVSMKHANFIVNTGGASAADVEELIRLVRAEVMARHGVDLIPEVRVVGEAA